MSLQLKLLAAAITTALLATGCNKAPENTQANTVEESASQVETTLVDQSTKEDDKPFMYAVETGQVTATVSAVDQETRKVTLTNEDGSTQSFIAGPEVRNLAQVEVGDELITEFERTLSITVIDPSLTTANARPVSTEISDVEVAELGEKPGMLAVDTSVDVLEVTDINIEANTFKLKDSSGDITQYTARNPENLKKAAVGDFVIVTIEEAVAIYVTEGQAANKAEG